MAVVGTKGQIVIDKPLRDRLGVGPGWRAEQSIENGRLVVDFLPPVHRDSLAGCLEAFVRPGVEPVTEEGIDRVVQESALDEWLRSE
jgi:bifunctional DNA-binding transcriptional regulator/antitoxin component of YhaV-PrlF toxin-antitoxin module